MNRMNTGSGIDDQLTVGKNFRLVADRWSDRIALVEPDRESYTYAELNQRVNSMVRGLSELGVKGGDRVAIMFPNSFEFVCTHLALQKLGACTVMLNFRLSGDETRYILNDAQVELFLYDSTFRESAEKSLTDLDIEGMMSGREEFDELVNLPAEEVDLPVSRTDISYIAYTSGSTGRPKGVPHTHDDVILGSSQVIQEMSITRRDRALHIAPLFHTVSMNCFFVPHLFMGATNVLQPQFDPERTLELIEQKKITGTLGVPAQIKAILRVEDIDRYDLSSLRYVRTGGDPILKQTVDEAQDKLAEGFYNTYGLTEAQQNVTAFTPDDPPEKKTSVGKATYYWDLRVVEPAEPHETDPDQEISPPGTGMILVGGPMLMEGYINRPEATENVFVDGWLYTGDIAELDRDGYIHIVDRMDNMIKSAAENIYPQEVEEVLGEHPSVLDCGVFGTDHEEWGEAVTAAVVLDDEGITDEELDQFMLETDRLANFKRPRRYVFVEEIPRNPGSGSIQREQLVSMVDD